MLGPILGHVARQVGETATVVKVNVDELPDLAMRYRVSSIPALFVLRDGDVVDQAVGVQPEARLVQMLEQAAAAGARP
jgi:thioredoxin 1